MGDPFPSWRQKQKWLLGGLNKREKSRPLFPVHLHAFVHFQHVAL